MERGEAPAIEMLEGALLALMGILLLLPGFITDTLGFLLLFLVAMNLVIPRFFCRVLCPLGALLGVFSRFAVFRINRDVHKCTDCNVCLSRCEGASDPQGQLRLSECFACMNCIDDCPENALEFTLLRQDKKQVVVYPLAGKTGELKKK